MENMSIKARLRLIKLLVAAGILLGIGTAHQALNTRNVHDREYHALQSAIRAELEEDRLVEALRGDVYSTLVTDSMVRASGFSIEDWQNDIDDLRRALGRLENAGLPADLRPAIDTNINAAYELIGSIDRIEKELVDGATDTTALLGAFEMQLDQLGSRSRAATAALSEAAAELEERLETASGRATYLVALTGLVSVISTLFLISLISRSIQQSLNNVAQVAGDIAQGQLESRYANTNETEVGRVGACLNMLAESLQEKLAEIRSDSARRHFRNQLMAALEIADSEADVFQLVARAMTAVSADHSMEMLLADSSQAHLETAVVHPTQGAPGCGVRTPNECMAVRRGSILHFTDSEQLDTCPHLRDRDGGPLSATCAPITFMGNALGVLHTASPIDTPLDDDAAQKFRNIGSHVGNRIGMLRAFERSQVQAATDSLTGLPNRRSLELALRRLTATAQDFTLVMADLDHFKKLNDRYGHQAGDSALKLFARILKNSLRTDDIASRWGGEEFVVLLSGTAEHEALAWTDRVRQSLHEACEKYGGPGFSASFGIVHSSLAGDLTALHAIADEALYRSKEDGRDRTTVGVSPLGVTFKRHHTDRNALLNLADLTGNS